MAKRPTYDWEAIEKDYRTGLYSFRQLETMHGPRSMTISQKAKSKGWTKDLSKNVQDRTRDILTTGNEDSSMPRPSDEAIIEAAATTAASVVFQHRAWAKKGRDVVSAMLEKLGDQVDAGRIEVKDRDGEIVGIDLPLDYMGKAASNMVTAMEKLVKIERQAYNLDVPQDDEKPEAKLTEAQIDERIRRLASEAPES